MQERVAHDALLVSPTLDVATDTQNLQNSHRPRAVSMCIFKPFLAQSEPVALIDVVTHEEVVSVVRLASDIKKLNQVKELAIDFTKNRDVAC